MCSRLDLWPEPRRIALATMLLHQGAIPDERDTSFWQQAANACNELAVHSKEHIFCGELSSAVVHQIKQRPGKHCDDFSLLVRSILLCEAASAATDSSEAQKSIPVCMSPTPCPAASTRFSTPGSQKPSGLKRLVPEADSQAAEFLSKESRAVVDTPLADRLKHEGHDTMHELKKSKLSEGSISISDVISCVTMAPSKLTSGQSHGGQCHGGRSHGQSKMSVSTSTTDLASMIHHHHPYPIGQGAA